MKTLPSLVCGMLLLAAVAVSAAPSVLNHQGRVAVGGVLFDGTGQFKFALVDASGTTSYWSNDGTGAAGSEPGAFVSLTVTKGLYATLLGDTALANMMALPDTVFENDDVRLRVWFNDGVTGFEQITPDYRLASAPYALMAAEAESVPDGSITASSIAAGAIGSAQLNVDLTLGGTTTGTFAGDGSGLTGVVLDQVLLSIVMAPPSKPVVAWGDNDDGQVTVPALADVAAVAASPSQSLALLDDGTVEAWGSGPSVPGGLSDVTAIAAGTAHALARKNDGTVAMWGDNSYDQITDPGLTTATAVAAGEKHSLALLADGTVTAWGDNTFNQTTIPGGLATVISIASGYDHCLALKGDGTVVAWGRSDAGQIAVPGGLSNVVAIAAGAYHSLALKDDGTVVAWGWNSGGQVTVPVGLTGVTAVAGGYAFSMALKSDGTLEIWGDNSEGQSTPPFEATQVTMITAGANHALALRADLIPAQVARLDQDNEFTGRVGIGRVAATNTLEVEGRASKTTAGTWLSNSDRRIKTDVQPISDAIGRLNEVRLVEFRYTADYLREHPVVEDRRYLNVIAQEFAKVFPEHVRSSGETLADGSEILQVDTYPLTIYAAAAVQELHRENEDLKRRLADQEARLRKLEESVGR